MKIEVNGREVNAESGDTILDSLRREGLDVPTLCHMKGMTPTGACRICVVEVAGARGLVPSCSFPAAEGMRIQTHSPRVLDARRTVVELLLASHPDDCLYCGKSGRCDLQSLSQELGVSQRRFGAPSPSRRWTSRAPRSCATPPSASSAAGASASARRSKA